jgi:hypothetical protein
MESSFLIWLTHCDRLVGCHFHIMMRPCFDIDESRWHLGPSQTDRSCRPANLFLYSRFPFNIFRFHIQLLIDLSIRVLETRVKIHTSDEIKWLNMDPKPDKECGIRGDMILLSEIISNSIYWQVIYSRATVKFRAGSKHIINIAEFQINKSGVRLIC